MKHVKLSILFFSKAFYTSIVLSVSIYSKIRKTKHKKGNDKKTPLPCTDASFRCRGY